MAKILRPREWVTTETNRYVWMYEDETGCGLVFAADDDGHLSAGSILADGGTPYAVDRVASLLFTGRDWGQPDFARGTPIRFVGMQTSRHSYRLEAIAECSDCGADVHLSEGCISECDNCESRYNSAGTQIN